MFDWRLWEPPANLLGDDRSLDGLCLPRPLGLSLFLMSAVLPGLVAVSSLGGGIVFGWRVGHGALYAALREETL